MSRTNAFANTLNKKNQFLWMMLAFHAGYLNAGGFLSSHRFVSHMTGVGTAIGISFSLKDYFIALEMILAPISFILGAAYAGFLVDRKLVTEREPQVINGVLCIILLNVAVFAGGISGFFGEFGEPLLLQRDFLLLFVLTFVCGLQNGLFVSITSGQIRTTHITGLATDIGLNITKIFSLKNDDSKRNDIKKNQLRIKTVLAFSLGSFIGAIYFTQAHFWGFLGSVVISLFILAWSTKIIRDHDREIVNLDKANSGKLQGAG